MKNRLNNESSPYLLQHSNSPVNWFPWCRQAFELAAQNTKPIFLSIGYSTCHWCHVMAHESFENKEIADILNEHFISVKVDREERPDIDAVYMSVCQAFTGSGGWPMSIFMTADQKPFFAGYYFPPVSRHGMIGFKELLLTIVKQWNEQRSSLLTSADLILSALLKHSDVPIDVTRNSSAAANGHTLQQMIDSGILQQAVTIFAQDFDSENGGFGSAPKFPLPHNLLFLLLYALLFHEEAPLHQAVLTLKQMRKGGIFDQIGYGFSRYSTDDCFLVPHFEKMLYDNALLILAYASAYKATGDSSLLTVAMQTADYVFREMTGADGQFFSAQDADSEGAEGKYYVWTRKEINRILGSAKGSAFCSYYGITDQGNFEGSSIPNLLHSDNDHSTDLFEEERKQLYEYRRHRAQLHLDDKVLTSWNALMISALSTLYRVSGKPCYLEAAKKSQTFIEKHLSKDNILYVSYRNNKHSSHGFLDDYAYDTMALLSLYDATGNPAFLASAQSICLEAMQQFADKSYGGYFLYGPKNSPLITRPKETYDGALPSGNSVMAYCLVRLSQLTTKDIFKQAADAQLAFLSSKAIHYPAGYCMYLIALLYSAYPPQKITVLCSPKESAGELLSKLPLYADIRILEQETEAYRLLNNKTTYYVCKNYTCLPPTNEIPVSILHT